jgi:hypothetical protein
MGSLQPNRSAQPPFAGQADRLAVRYQHRSVPVRLLSRIALDLGEPDWARLAESLCIVAAAAGRRPSEPAITAAPEILGGVDDLAPIFAAGSQALAG